MFRCHKNSIGKLTYPRALSNQIAEQESRKGVITLPGTETPVESVEQVEALMESTLKMWCQLGQIRRQLLNNADNGSALTTVAPSLAFAITIPNSYNIPPSTYVSGPPADDPFIMQSISRLTVASFLDNRMYYSNEYSEVDSDRLDPLRSQYPLSVTDFQTLSKERATNKRKRNEKSVSSSGQADKTAETHSSSEDEDEEDEGEE